MRMQISNMDCKGCKCESDKDCGCGYAVKKSSGAVEYRQEQDGRCKKVKKI